MTPATDRLFGLLAVQLGLLPSDEASQLAATATRAHEPLATLLTRTGALPPEDVALLGQCVQRTLALHGTAEKAIAALALDAHAATQSFGGLDETFQSGEQRVSESAEGLDFVVAELPGRYVPDPRGELGRGGIGRVLSVKDQVLGRAVALKELHTTPGTPGSKGSHPTTTTEARFLREARLAAQLEHPAIVPVYEAGRRADGTLYYTMRRIEGRTLAAALTEARTLEGRLRLLPHLLAVAQAVAYAHQRTVLHRDLKPQNVMLGAFGETYLLDWGLARVKGKSDPRAKELTLAPDITGGQHLGAMGTPSYMSPEQAAGKVEELDERTDVWGLGAMLFELLTGRPPYLGVNAIDCMSRVLTEEVPPPESFEPNAPGDLVAVCLHALRKQKAHRYADAAAFARDLEAWIAGRTVSAHDYTPLELARRFVTRNRKATLAIAGLVLALVGVVGVAAWRVNAERQEARALAALVVRQLVHRLGSVPGAEELVDEVSQPTLAFYLAREPSLTADERALVAATYVTRAEIARNRGNLDEVQRAIEACRQILPRGSRWAEGSAAAAASALRCEVMAYQLADLKADEAAMKAQAGVLEELLRPDQARWPDSAEWARTRSHAYSSLGRLALRHGDSERSRSALRRAVELNRQARTLDPTVVDSRGPTVAGLSELSLVEYLPSAPDTALALGREALALAQAAPSRERNTRLLRTWGAALQQQVMLLKWSGHQEEATGLADEGRRVFSQLLALEPDDVQGQGVWADLLLDLGQPDEALRVLEKVVGGQVKGDYLSSLLMAALAAGHPERVLAAQADIAASQDAQAHWLNAKPAPFTMQPIVPSSAM